MSGNNNIDTIDKPKLIESFAEGADHCDHEDETDRNGTCQFYYDKTVYFKMPCVGCRWRNDVPGIQCEMCKHYLN